MMDRHLIALAAAALWIGGVAMGPVEGSCPSTATVPKKHTTAYTGQRPTTARGIIGSRRTRVYRRAAEGGSLPAARDRIYFRSEAQARAAGYRPARQRPVVLQSLPPSRSQSPPPASPLGRDQPTTAPTNPSPNF
jgi:hypothetical protein